ncbi:hypothetical protein BSLG_002014 [Batrachochytrium salamandrivorans]|nr:hypothetical protein BSLG_002014 [Batrachochytrium salamandrivorans]
MPLENTQDGAAADIEEPGFLLDLAPSLTVLLSHPTHSSALLDYELALLSSSLEQVHTAMPHIQLQSVLQTLSHLLLRPSLTADICHLFRPIIIDLVARWLLMHPTTYESALGKSLSINTTAMLMATASVDVTTNAISGVSSPKHARYGKTINSESSLLEFSPSVLFVEHLAVAFSRLLPIAPQIKAHAIAAFQNSPSLFSSVAFLVKNPSQDATDRLCRIIKSVYRLLEFSRDVFSSIWNPEPIYALLTYPDAAVRMYAAYSLSILIGMSDAERNTLLEHYTDKNNIDPKLALLPLVEQLQTESMHARMFESTSVTLTPGSNAQPRIMMDASSLSCLTVDMCGVLLPHNQLTTARFSSSVRLLPLDTSMISSGAIQDVSEKMTKLVHIKSTVDNLHQIGIAISLGLPVLLEGPPGVGKTALVEEASRILGSSDLLKIHLGDQTDSKLLLGTYMTTSTPGAFKWQPGVLVTAVSEGRWILIEDIDLAPVDVVAVLVPLLETRWLYIPSRGERIQAKDSFRIFATRRVAATSNGNSHSEKSRRKNASQKHLGESLWTTVFISELNNSEIHTIINSRFPILRGCVGEIMRSYDTLNAQFREMHAVGRQLSSRDLIKWCYPHLRQQIALCLGETLQIPQNRIEFYFENFIPNVTLDIPAGKLLCGRVVLPIFDAKIASARHPPFAPTAPSLRLIERLAVAVSLCEPILLVGETGTGKTTVVQHLASHVGSKLTVINMSQQSDSTDLLGGFKPVDALLLAAKVREEFESLFSRTFSVKNNSAFLASVQKAFIRRNWHQLSIGFERAVKMAKEVMSKIHAGTVAQKDKNQPEDESAPKKKRKHLDPSLAVEWDQFEISVNQLSAQLEQIKNNFLFSFVEGSLIQALRNGHWILLDEVNLASAETLECLSGLLQSSDGSIMLLERGDTVPIRRHPNFRLFACMNPANDAGKRDLPPGLRSRFTEFWVESPDACQADLLLIIRSYIFPHLPAGPAGDRICLDVAEFYSEAKSLAVQGILFDGADQRVHISMRTLTRALSYAMFIAPMYGIKRSLYEATYMTFMTGLGIKSWQQMMTMLRKSILNGVRNPDAFVKQIPKHPGVQDDMADLDEDILRDSPYTLIDCFWIEKGPLDIPTDLESAFVLTPSVQANLVNLSRAVLSRKYPVLIQGPTSAGKTSMVEYLAKRTGHRFLRINNHEHTDIQEYLGSYISNDQGALAFQDGVLVEALRKGYWIVLDELNLAPSDVLEALNRLLDDNRELFLPETQEVIKPHPHFMLFATQNPAGQYGGRKQLSRAFRNRFVELHFSDIPEGELEMIMEKRCRIAPSYAKRLVSVYKSLQKLRGTSRIFDGRQSFITLRDLFRWALRGAVGYQRLAEDGYMQLAERVRKLDDRAAIKKILEKEFKVVIDEEAMYDTMFEKIWSSLKMLAETSPAISCLVDGCGKTTVCQMLAALAQRHLHIVNAHQNSETADFLGSQRPTRGREQAEIELRKQVRILIDKAAPQTSGSFDLEMEKSRALFAWTDGPLVQAMKLGHFFLLDEISLADDSVIERLNSVLEPQRLLVLAENGAKEVEEIIAADEFRLFATMNPGGDYGKKELSPALRNRFTEIWVPSIVSRSDLLLILEKKLCVLQIPSDARILWGADAFFHGGCMVLIDGMSINPLLGTLGTSCASLSKTSRYILRSLSKGVDITDIVVHETLLESEGIEFDTSASPLVIRQLEFGNDLFCIPVGNAMIKSASFAMQAPTTLSNCMRVLRALQLNKPILLEGSPGVGKTSLIASLAAMSRHRLVRINLSEQTDLMDLFGSDLPVENGHGGEFAWRDGPFLKAMQEGDWVLLDELNLASQQVLEGLNSCLDHRATIYIPELDRNIACHPSFRVFAAQNPQNEGGGRKGLPKSFSNRFSQVYVSPLDMHSLRYICSALYPHLDTELTEKMIVFNERIREEIMVKCSFGWRGAPWEFNLRDVLRWIDMWQTSLSRFDDDAKKLDAGPGEFLEMIYTQRMRTRNDRNRVREIFVDIFGYLPDRCVNRPTLRITPNLVKIGNALLPRVALRGTHKYGAPTDNLQILPSSLPFLESLVQCIQTCSLPLLVGPSAVGKSSLVRLLSSIAGQRLHEITLNPGVDALELLGGFEQVDLVRRSQGIVDDIEELMNMVLATGILKPNIVSSSTLAQIQADWSIFCLNRVTVPMEESMSALRRLLGDLKAVSSSLFPSLDAFEDIQSSIEAYSRLADSGIRGRFEWMDSALVRALKHGDWILIDNVNLCSESVLDRLNSLVETNGCLIISERGLVDGDIQIITPHPNFRLFMAMDPTYGEISRAMRNRSVEIYIDDFEKSVDSNVVSVTKLTSAAGFLGDALATVLARTSSDAIGFDSFDQENTDSRTPVLDARLIVEHLQRGDTLETALMSILDADTASSVLKSMATYGGVFPTCWPLFVSGKLTIQCSELASVASSASAIVMYTSPLASELKFVSPVARMPLLSELPSIHDLVVAALDVFIQDVSVSDLHLRKSWLSFWAENLGSDADPMFIEALKLALFLMETDHVVTAIGHAGVAARAEFARVGISGSDADKFPVDLQLVDLAGIQPAKSSSTSDTNLTPIVKLMDRRRELWESAQTVVVDIAKLVLCIRRISKLLPACIALCDANSIDITSLHSSIEDAWESFSVEKIKALGVLWKLGGITTLRTAVLSTIADQFESVNAALDTSSQGPSAWIFRRTITSMGLDIKRAIMEGVSTLHYLNEEEEPSNNLVTMLQEVPAKLTESITKLDTPQPISLLAMSGIDSQLSAVTLWPFHDTWALASELTLIEQIYAYLHDEHPDNQLLVRSIRSFISSAITSTSLPPLHFEPLQRLVWVLDSGSNQHTPHVVSDQSQHQFVYTIAQEALHQWNKSFWANGFTFWRSHSMTDRESFMMNGQILQLLDLESEIASGLSMSSGKQTLQSMHVPLYNGLSGHTLAMLESISKVPVYSSGSKVIQMKMLLQQTASPDFEVAQRNKFDLSVLIASDIERLKEMLLQVKSARMQTIIKLYLSPMIDSIAVCSQTLPCSETQLNIEFANAWVLYALAFLEAYIPDLPVDPVAMRTAKISLSTRYSDRLKADILVNADKEFLQTANPPSPKLKTKLADLEDEAAKMFKWRSKLPIRPSRSQMVDIVNELQQVKQSILHLPTIKLLLVELVSPSGVSLDILHQEESLQDVVQSVIDRIEAKYPHYRDLLLPACTALYQLKYGIRLMRHAGSILHLRDASTSVAPLVRFVQDFQLENLDVALENASSIRGNSRQLMQTKLKIQLATIEQLAAFLQTGTHIDVDVIIRMHALFDAVVDLWGEAEVQRQRMEEEKESLFIMKQASVVTDEEREEAEFRERFPDFFETFADIAPVDPLNDSDPLKNAPTVPKQPAIIPTFDPSQAWRIVLDAAMTVCQLDGVSVPPTMDVIGRLGFVYASAKHVSDFSTTTVTSSDLYDFYNDSNVFEAQQIQPLLVKFDTRINALLVQWPDHDVLVHLSAICRRVASFPVASPLMKLLTGIELLLTKSQDWEAYASKEVSLRSCLDDFVLFIVKWRRLELNTWRQLLKLEERRCAAKVGSLWFHLWRTTMGILRNPKPESHELDALKDPLVNDLFTTFDNLCLSSPVGQFEERLQILRSFHKHLLLLEKHCPCDMFTGLKTIINLLWNVTEYYFQFLPSVQLFISTSRKPILTELKKYVKIATWKDVNVFALKESAKRTHYNLNKFVKKYMLVLEKPVKDVIASFQEAPPSMSTLLAKAMIDPDVMWDMALTSAADSCQTALCVPLALIIDESNLGTKYRVSNTERLLAKMKSLTRSVISENIFAGAASGIEEFSATILERVKAFRDVNVAAQSDVKIVKGQK